VKVGVIHNLRAGGAHRCLSELLANLDVETVEICLASADPIAPNAIVVPFRLIAPELPAAARPPFRYLDLARLLHAWRRAGEAVERERPDVVFANPCRFLQAPAALLHVSAPSLYLCQEPRESDAVLAATRNPRTLRLYAPLHAREQRIDRAIVARASKLAANSRYSAGEIKRVYGRSSTMLPMGIPPRFTPSFEPTSHLLSVGTLIPIKGHELVIRTAGLARTRRDVVIVAPRPDTAEEARLMTIAAEAGVELTIRTGITDDELVAAYRQAHATLYLAEGEPFGLASLEAQACGSPAIVSDEGGLPETIVDGETGWAVRRDPAAAAKAVDRLDEPEVRSGMARAAAAHGAAATWARTTQQLAELLGGLVANGGPRSTF